MKKFTKIPTPQANNTISSEIRGDVLLALTFKGEKAQKAESVVDFTAEFKALLSGEEFSPDDWGVMLAKIDTVSLYTNAPNGVN